MEPNKHASIENRGTYALLRPLTPEAEAWLYRFTEAETWEWMADALVCEPRYAESIVRRMLADLAPTQDDV